jgi:hypothetical protein
MLLTNARTGDVCRPRRDGHGRADPLAEQAVYIAADPLAEQAVYIAADPLAEQAVYIAADPLAEQAVSFRTPEAYATCRAEQDLDRRGSRETMRSAITAVLMIRFRSKRNRDYGMLPFTTKNRTEQP